MNKYFKIILFLVIGITIASCSKTDPTPEVALRDYKVQYATDMDSINKYIDTHYITVDSDYNVTMTKIPIGGSQQSIRLQQTFPLQFKMVQNDDHDVNYKIYYLNLREGTSQSTSAVDSVYVSYRGILVSDQQFDYSETPIWFQLQSVVEGWGEIIPLFKTGTYDTAEGPNPTTFTNFGAGVMFLPSGLGYYNQIPSANIPYYSPLIFSFKLKSQRSRDHDRDGVLSKYEVSQTVVGQKPKDYDSDGDKIPNYYDIDDDGDYFMTKVEIKRPNVLNSNNISVPNGYFSFNGAAIDNPLTPNIDERQGIPRKYTGPVNTNNLPTPLPADFTDPTRIRRYLDPTSYPPFE
ncbi:MAG: FKBP-type peptidylprolyl isomerase [Flavobacteriaceae bacterium]|nr:FKBP-type peptidylprolyl isomerase [Flavobacteriaceae bacterium]